jgi:hypothetical protein
MSLTSHELFTSYPCIFDSLTINHIRSVRVSPNVQDYMIIPGGSVDPALVAEVFSGPAVDVTSGDLSVLATCSPVTGLALSSSQTIQWQARAPGGTFAGAGANAILTGYAGWLGVEEISARQDAKEGASIHLKYYALYDGTHEPLSMSTAQNLSGVVAYNALYALSSVVWEGSNILGVQSVTVRPGIKFVTRRSSGFVYPDVGTINERRPMIEVKGTNLSLASGVGLDVDAISSGLTVYFRKINGTGSVNVSVTAAAGGYTVESIGAQGTGDAEAGIKATITGTLSFSTAAALP